MRTLVAMGLLLASIAAAHAFGFGLEGRGFGKLGASPKKGTAVAAATGKVLMVDGVSFILQTDAASKICRAGGC